MQQLRISKRSKKYLQKMSHEMNMSTMKKQESEISEAYKLYVQRQYNEAIAILERIIVSDAKCYEAYYTLGQIYEEMQEDVKSFYCFWIYAHLHKEKVEFWKRLYALSEKLSLTREQAYILSVINKIEPTKDRLEKIILLYVSLNDRQKALKALGKFYVQYDKSDETAYRLCSEYFANNKLLECVRLLEEITSKGCKDSRVLTLYCDTLIALNRYEQLLEFFSTVNDECSRVLELYRYYAELQTGGTPELPSEFVFYPFVVFRIAQVLYKKHGYECVCGFYETCLLKTEDKTTVIEQKVFFAEAEKKYSDIEACYEEIARKNGSNYVFYKLCMINRLLKKHDKELFYASMIQEPEKLESALINAPFEDALFEALNIKRIRSKRRKVVSPSYFLSVRAIYYKFYFFFNELKKNSPCLKNGEDANEQSSVEEFELLGNATKTKALAHEELRGHCLFAFNSLLDIYKQQIKNARRKENMEKKQRVNAAELSLLYGDSQRLSLVREAYGSTENAYEMYIRIVFFTGLELEEWFCLFSESLGSKLLWNVQRSKEISYIAVRSRSLKYHPVFGPKLLLLSLYFGCNTEDFTCVYRALVRLSSVTQNPTLMNLFNLIVSHSAGGEQSSKDQHIRSIKRNVLKKHNPELAVILMAKYAVPNHISKSMSTCERLYRDYVKYATFIHFFIGVYYMNCALEFRTDVNERIVKAEEYFRIYLEESCYDFYSCYNVGRAYQTLKNYPAALYYYNLALKMKEDPRVLNNIKVLSLIMRCTERFVEEVALSE